MADPTYADRDVMVRGLRLHYQEWGDASAPPILLLHGFGVSGHMFDEFAARMRPRYRLIALDQRGHGDSDWSPDGDYTRATFVRDAEAFRDALGLDRFVLVGHSMGGMNAAAYAASHPGRVQALVLVDVGPESAREGVENIMRFTQGPDNLEFDEFVERAHQFNPRRSLDNIRERMRHRLKPGEDGKWTWKFDRRFRDPESGVRVGEDESNDDRWQLFRSIHVPTLIVRGAESDILAQDVAERAAREMPRARLIVVPGAGHSVPGDNPDDFTAGVRDFLDDVAAGRFVPAGAAQPPLDALLDAHDEARRRRRPGTLPMLLLGLGAVLAIAGALCVAKQRKPKSRRARLAALPHALPQRLPEHVDLDLARRRAAAVVEELGAVGQRGVRRARRRLEEADIDRARATAEEVVHALGAQARQAPVAIRTAAKQAERRTRKTRKKSRNQALGLLLPVVLALAARTQEQASRRRVRRWRA